jgi:hypothetical protein
MWPLPTREFRNNPIGWSTAERKAPRTTTGREFLRHGTAKPLHAKYIEGTMPFKDVLEDIYAQTCLPRTRPEDCSRDPFTLKLTDIRLTGHAGGYDEDALTFGEEDTEREAPWGFKRHPGIPEEHALGQFSPRIVQLKLRVQF